MDVTVTYRVIRLTELMTHEFAQVEGDIERLTEKAVGTVVPHGMNFSHFKDKLKSGELALSAGFACKACDARWNRQNMAFNH